MNEELLRQIDAILREREKLNRKAVLVNESKSIHEALQKERDKLFGDNRLVEDIDPNEMEVTNRLINEYNRIREELNSLL